MNGDVTADFKQFITAVISRQTAELRTQIERKVDEKTAELKRDLGGRITGLQTAVSDALDTGNNVVDEQLRNHERRIARLVHRAA